MSIILASGSPRRRELMEMLRVPDLKIIPAKGEETAPQGAGPGELVMALASAKGHEVGAQCAPGDVIIAADTIVWVNGGVFGKPHSPADAKRMLRALSGGTHEVHTGVCICRGRRAAATVETTVVHFSPIAEDDLCAYVRTPEPYDKAGAYAIQGHAALWCAGIEGCYYNIMGLPVHRTAQLLRELT